MELLRAGIGGLLLCLLVALSGMLDVWVYVGVDAQMYIATKITFVASVLVGCIGLFNLWRSGDL